MQINILKPDSEAISRLQNVISYAYDVYDLESVETYVVQNDGDLGFLFLGKNINLYINDKDTGLEFTAYSLDENGEIIYYGVGDYRIFFEDGKLVAVDKNSNELSLFCVNLSKKLVDSSSYNGYFNFWQYNQLNDVCCNIQYAQNLRSGVERNFNVYLNEIENIFIDPRYSIKGCTSKGLVSGGKKYFSRVTCEEFTVEGDSFEVSKYVPIRYISQDQKYYTASYLSKKYDLNEIKELIEKNGFLSDVPSMLLDIYNGTDVNFRKLKWIIREVAEERKKSINEKAMVFQIHLD